MTDLELLPENDYHRKIIHLDMDAFYASVEMRDQPQWRQKALIVAHDPRQHHGHGVITTANYYARQFGVGSAMPAMKAVERIPKDKLVFVSPNFPKYRAVSDAVHAIMHEVSDQVESVALDEAYLDVTHPKLAQLSGIELASYLQQKIYRDLHLTCSFGVSYNKFLAKMGSEYAKPFGRTLILPQQAEAFLARQDIAKFPGIGQKTQQILREMGINNGLALQRQSVRFLMQHFKKYGYVMAMHVHGIDLNPVVAKRQRKSIGTERTFEPAIFDRDRALTQLRLYSEKVASLLVKQQLLAKTVVLKIRNQDFVTVTKRQSLRQPSQQTMVLYQASQRLFDQVPEFLNQGIRLLGVSVTSLQSRGYSEVNLPIFDTNG